MQSSINSFIHSSLLAWQFAESFDLCCCECVVKCVAAFCGKVILPGWRLHFSVNVQKNRQITLQDGRCTGEFLSFLPSTEQPIKISTSYGCVPWLQKNNCLTGWHSCTTYIINFLFCVLYTTGKPLVCTHNGNSWGYFDRQTNYWKLEFLVSCLA